MLKKRNSRWPKVSPNVSLGVIPGITLRERSRSLIFSIFLISGFFISGACPPVKADQDEIRVPVEVSVDPYFQLLLDSECVRIGPDGHDGESRPISAGSLSFGTEIGKLESSMAAPVPESDGGLFSTTHKTVTHVTVLNNVKPFELRIAVLPEGAATSLAEMKSSDQKGALRIKVDADEKTKHPEYLVQKGAWVDFGIDASLSVYNSHEMVSDSFLVSFAIIDLDPKTKATQYGGRVLWTLSGTL